MSYTAEPFRGGWAVYHVADDGRRTRVGDPYPARFRAEQVAERLDQDDDQ